MMITDERVTYPIMLPLLIYKRKETLLKYLITKIIHIIIMTSDRNHDDNIDDEIYKPG